MVYSARIICLIKENAKSYGFSIDHIILTMEEMLELLLSLQRAVNITKALKMTQYDEAAISVSDMG